MFAKRKTIITVFVLLQLCCSSLWARPTAAYEAEMVVTGWLKADPRPLDTALGREVMNIETFTDAYGEPVYYIVYLRGRSFAGTEPSGFVIVSGDDLVEPIIGFAEDGTYDPSLENPLGALVTNDLNGRIAAVRNTFSALALHANPEVTETQSKWNHFISLAETPKGAISIMEWASLSDVRVAPLLGNNTWGQTEVCGKDCYNYYTPNNYKCGCVATSMAQVMRYHQHPTTGIGVREFQIKVDDVAQRASTRGGDGNGGPYRWNLMVLEPGCRATLEQRQAIGALCYDAGVAVNMNYSETGSGAYSSKVAPVLLSTFLYNNAVEIRMTEISPELIVIGMINPNLDADSPVIVSVRHDQAERGHMCVCDGYGYNASAPYHHINVGWSGKDNAWYNLPNIGSFNVFRGCTYNIFTSGSGEIISGRVTDTFGRPISAAAVQAEGRGGPYNTVTNSKGIYALVQVKPSSTYTVSVTKSPYYFAPQDVRTGRSEDLEAVSGNRWGVDFLGVKIRLYAEGFETGSFGRFPWEHYGDESWVVTSEQKHFGNYSAQAGPIDSDQYTTMEITLDCGSGDISFYSKVSSERGCDYLVFYIDGVRQDEWSGEQDWTQASFPVTEGTRTFNWTYSKDGSGSEGDDSAWIDEIAFPLAAVSKVASNPCPADGAVDVDPITSLSWTAGSDAVSHDVYVGENFDDVYNGTGGTFRRNQTATSFNVGSPRNLYYPNGLIPGTTYYWRIDEVNDLHPDSPWKGGVWSFRVALDISIIDLDLVGWWKLDDGSGTTASDSSGKGFNMRLHNTTWEDGVYGGAVHFHGVGHGDVGNFRYSDNAITVCAWAWHDAFIIGKVERYVTVSPEVAVIRKEADGRLHFYIKTDGNLRHLCVSGLTEGRWHHVAGTWDGRLQHLYLDGVEMANQAPVGVLADTSSVEIGSGGEPFNGMLDDVRIYNRALTQDEIQVVMQGTE